MSVASVALRADADEEKGKCRIVAEFILNVEGCVYEETVIDGITDAFSTTNLIMLDYGEVACVGAGERYHSTERISGKAALSGTIDFSDVLQAVILQRAEANLTGGENTCAEGVAAATLMVLSADGTRRGIEMSLPFSVPVTADSDCTVSVMACGMSARQRQEGEIDVEATLKITVSGKKKLSFKQVTGVTEGAAIEESDCAVSVFIPRAGDGLWELSKSLKKPPEEVSLSNPDIEFPIKEGQRVIVYRKKSLPL